MFLTFGENSFCYNFNPKFKIGIYHELLLSNCASPTYP